MSLKKKTVKEIVEAIMARKEAMLASHFPRVVDEEIKLGGHTELVEKDDIRPKVVGMAIKRFVARRRAS